MSLPQRRRLIWWLNWLGAVLVVAGSIGVTLSLVRSSREASSTAALWRGGAVEWGGLSVAMTVTPGPYFMGELLVVDLSLTNSSSTTYTLAGAAEADPCGGAVYATISGGTSSRNALPVFPEPYCPSCGPYSHQGKPSPFIKSYPFPGAGTWLCSRVQTS
jgi:hypothetical protein